MTRQAIKNTISFFMVFLLGLSIRTEFGVMDDWIVASKPVATVE
jgi:hypothetical protein